MEGENTLARILDQANNDKAAPQGGLKIMVATAEPGSGGSAAGSRGISEGRYLLLHLHSKRLG